MVQSRSTDRSAGQASLLCLPELNIDRSGEAIVHVRWPQLLARGVGEEAHMDLEANCANDQSISPQRTQGEKAEE